MLEASDHDFPMNNDDFPMENDDFPVKNDDFPIKNGDFPMNNDEFLVLSGASILNGPIGRIVAGVSLSGEVCQCELVVVFIPRLLRKMI